jgi:Predicted hydrolases of HD superfamily
MSFYDDIQFIRNGMNVRRFHQHPTNEIDTVGKHSCGVALLANLINPFARKEVLLAALYHDLGEWVLGDIPAPTKKMLSPSAKDEIDEIEVRALEARGYDTEALTEDEARLLKICDCLDGLLFCIEEIHRGNSPMVRVRDKYEEYLYYILDNTPVSHWTVRASEIFRTIVKESRNVVR